MTFVSSKEFISNEDKYFDLALNGGVCIQRGDYLFHLVCAPFEEQYPPPPFLEPDDDFRRAITIDELHRRVKNNVHKWYSQREI